MKTKYWTIVVLALLTAMMSVAPASAKPVTVKGKVTAKEDGSVIIGCSVLIKGTRNGTLTDTDGKYAISANTGDTLVFSYIGCITQEKTVKSAKLNVVLQESPEALKESMVTGYTVGESVEDVSSEEIRIMYVPVRQELPSEEYNEIVENGFMKVKDTPLSTFSIDVDAAAYGNMRRYLNKGQLPPADAVRTEELINYFSYDYAKPTGDAPVKITTEVGACPWNPVHRLVRIGLKAREIPTENLPVSNLVFLIDVSGSMYGAERLDLVKSSLKLLVNNLRDKDRVAIVVYSGAAGERLLSTSGSDKQKIKDAIDELEAGGSTAGGAGIELAYKIARKNFVPGVNNLIILCTDGDFNVGISSGKALEKLIEKERKTGVFLTVLGYGMGNYKDGKMQVLAEKGNGNHAYIDNLQEANRVLVNEFGATMHTVAKDVKLQVEFNPAQVQAYRLIGYESRLLQDEDFNNDAKDAGEMGAGHTVTAFYEVIPAGVESDYAGKVDELKYQKPEKTVPVSLSKELLTVKLRYKQPDGDSSKRIEITLADDKANKVSVDFHFASAVAMFGQLLRDSDYKGTATYDKIISLAKTGLGKDAKGYKREFIRLVEIAKGLDKE